MVGVAWLLMSTSNVKSPARGVDRTLVFTHAGQQRFEIEFFERSFRAKFETGMTHQQLVVDQKDVRLDTAETLLQRVEQRPGVIVVVMGVCLGMHFRCKGATTCAGAEVHEREDD